jgi:hypothetical protein
VGYHRKHREEVSSCGDVTVTFIYQNTAISSMTVTTHNDKIHNAKMVVPLSQSLSDNFVQGTPLQNPNQEHSLSSLPGRKPDPFL